MAQAGLTVYNNQNFLQIDSNFKNYSLVMSRIITDRFTLNFESTEYAGGGATNFPIVTVSGNDPLIAIHCNYGTRPFRVDNGNGTFSFYIMLSNWGAVTIPFRLVYYIFDTVTTVTGNYGLQVFDANGIPVFDSSRFYMKPLNQIQDTAAPWASFGSPLTWTRTYPTTSSKPALITCLQAVRMELNITGGGSETITETGVFVVSGRYINGSIEFRCFLETQISASGGGGTWVSGTPYWRSLVIDVEGLPETYG